MKPVLIRITKPLFNKIHEFFVSNKRERAVFLLLRRERGKKSVIFKTIDYYFVPVNMLNHSVYTVELREKVLPKIIKWAWDKKCSLAEIHSHPLSEKDTTFSYSDLLGMEEFVSHVWWRLKKRPYFAIVMGKNDFDALVWLTEPDKPQKIEGLLVDKELLKPTNKTLV